MNKKLKIYFLFFNGPSLVSFDYFRLFQINITNKSKKVHPVYGARIWTQDRETQSSHNH